MIEGEMNNAALQGVSSFRESDPLQLEQFDIKSSLFSRSSPTHPEANQDRVLDAPDIGLYAVFDGMGGYNGGEVASSLALSTIEEYVRAHALILI